MHPQLQDLAEGFVIHNLEGARRRGGWIDAKSVAALAVQAAASTSNQVARDLAFRPHMAALGPATDVNDGRCGYGYVYRSVLGQHCLGIPLATTPCKLLTPLAYASLIGRRWQAGPTHDRSTASAAEGSAMLPASALRLGKIQSVSGKPTLVDAAPASIYDSALQLRLLLAERNPCSTSASVVSLLGPQAMAAAEATGASHKREVRALRLATGWSQICYLAPMQDTLGSRLSPATVFCIVPFVKGECRPKGGLDSEEIYDLQAIFAERPAPTANSEIPAPNNPHTPRVSSNVDPRSHKCLRTSAQSLQLLQTCKDCVAEAATVRPRDGATVGAVIIIMRMDSGDGGEKGQ
ncbi:hypothetical protein HPB52_024264 [Rhipicephalus sanguineus]|uniref:Uncharacterized protein n=1 Tax=Rhipicephalus sanguineus TaxID=34632 RepID=A0A9D4YRD4_RHISA|nr:hypothetical protein HPB52_024264 [Rhipicephalus sanguineus]